MEIKDIEQRLDNWGFVVRDPKTRPQFCASWARTAVALRDAESRADSDAMPRNDVSDGWMVEQAWQLIRDPLAKRLLQHHYVFRYSPELVCRILVRKYSASPSVAQHWDVRLSKSKVIILKVLDEIKRDGESEKYFNRPLVNPEKLFYAVA
ncbi:hypothetical protein QZM35_22945 [Burkholderia sp. AU45274]|uniref:hypothetical protein n=1 Tax=Burkholderia sp. AU45274 TaxID=3059205 RepID=UPI0026522B56|nr:hypothetical protein [Burkholderia sp. AU45274]MDN7490573.1 hypothetical protein [Burkholderia sp. AU45274]